MSSITGHPMDAESHRTDGFEGLPGVEREM